MGKNLKTEWIESNDIRTIQELVNTFGQIDNTVVRYTQTHTTVLNDKIFYTAIIFYED